MKTINLTIKGITCDACIKIIKKRISSIDGVQNVIIHDKNGKTEILSSGEIKSDEVKKVLEDTHYTIEV